MIEDDSIENEDSDMDLAFRHPTLNESHRKQIVSLFRFMAANGLSLADLDTTMSLIRYMLIHELLKD